MLAVAFHSLANTESIEPKLVKNYRCPCSGDEREKSDRYNARNVM